MSEIAIAVALALAQAALGSDALQVVDEVLGRRAPPAGAPALARELLAQPLRALDADAIFQHAVPGALARFGSEGVAQGTAQPFDEVLGGYLLELEAARDALLAATSGNTFEARLLEQLPRGLPSSDQLAAVAAAVVDPAALERANLRFLEATARFVQALRAPGMQLPPPRRFASRIGSIVIGGPGDDRHAADAALIIDPGGNDRYERAPVSGGAVSVIVDLGGDDHYSGSDVVVRALSALVDLGGDDLYEAIGPGLGAAIAGTALIFDAAGDDRYSAATFGQGAAAFGLGALVDLRGNDSYRLQAGGQGYGLAGGVGLLWDRDGNDRYRVAGFEDPFRRGSGGLSFAQGAASGYREAPEVGGGIGILRDERGDDAYEAEMFAQGVGYFHGVGLLWDGGGNDRYQAVRYAQGNGAHMAVGTLRDESGNDRYELSFGVGQGMGLDLAVGALLDAEGNDVYEAGLLAQGSATANGIGLLADRGGVDVWRMTQPGDQRSWGHAEWYCGLPSVGLFLPQGSAQFERAGAPAQRRESARQVHEEPAPGAACGARVAALRRLGASPEPAARASFLPR